MAKKRSKNTDQDKFKNQVEKVFEDVWDLNNGSQSQVDEGEVAKKTSRFSDNLSRDKNIPKLLPTPFSDQLLEEDIIPAIRVDSIDGADQTVSKPGSMLWDIIWPVLIAALIYFVTDAIYLRSVVIGPSMEPSISNHDYLLVNKVVYSSNSIRRGDVIVFQNPGSSGEILVKRVVGIPGDQIEIIGGWLFVNNTMLDEPYLGTPDILDYPEITIPDGAIFVLGDNRRVSTDSRDWGPLSIDYVLGKADFVYWPLRHIGLVEHYQSALLQP